jgi:hypothetical protein
VSISELELPSNRKFGFFFTVVFLGLSAYFYIEVNYTWFYLSASLATTFFIVTLIKADVLQNLNKLWMRFGLLLGMIVSPIVLGAIFFLLFTPVAIAMRLFKRDELRLRFKKKSSHWIKRETELQSQYFKQQF